MFETDFPHPTSPLSGRAGAYVDVLGGYDFATKKKVLQTTRWRSTTCRSEPVTDADPHAASRIADERLRAVIGEPMDFVRAKLGVRLNPAMRIRGQGAVLLVGTMTPKGR